MRAQPSAIWLRQELPVHKNKIFLILSNIWIDEYTCYEKTSTAASRKLAAETVHVIPKNVLFLIALGKTFQQHGVCLASGRGQRIVHPLRLLASDDEPRTAQVCQVAGRRWLGHVEDRHNMAYAQFADFKQMQDSQPRLVGERPEYCFRGRWRGVSFHICISEYTR
jgi:hypothetical protein